jgi:hypothetical protein
LRLENIRFQAASAKVLKVLRNRAELFVAIGWLLFVVSIPICLAIGSMAGFNKFYFPRTERRR